MSDPLPWSHPDSTPLQDIQNVATRERGQAYAHHPAAPITRRVDSTGTWNAVGHPLTTGTLRHDAGATVMDSLGQLATLTSGGIYVYSDGSRWPLHALPQPVRRARRRANPPGHLGSSISASWTDEVHVTPDLTDLHRHWRNASASWVAMADVVTDAWKGLAASVENTRRALADAGVLEHELPTDPRARALALRHRRSTGPADLPLGQQRRTR